MTETHCADNRGGRGIGLATALLMMSEERDRANEAHIQHALNSPKILPPPNLQKNQQGQAASFPSPSRKPGTTMISSLSLSTPRPAKHPQKDNLFSTLYDDRTQPNSSST